jgi:hypothetical protein
MALNKRSHLITHGVARSPNRAMAALKEAGVMPQVFGVLAKYIKLVSTASKGAATD